MPVVTWALISLAVLGFAAWLAHRWLPRPHRQLVVDLCAALEDPTELWVCDTHYAYNDARELRLWIYDGCFNVHLVVPEYRGFTARERARIRRALGVTTQNIVRRKLGLPDVVERRRAPDAAARVHSIVRRGAA